MLKDFIQWYLGALESGGYPLIAFLMAVESSIIPLPSEVVIGPAAHLAHTKGSFSMAGIIVAGTVGSWLGASVMYWISRLAGRHLLLRFGKLILIPPHKIKRAERWAAKFKPMDVFMSRLLPVVRHLIGIPAGFVRMDYGLYSVCTLLGSAIWCSVLCWVGVEASKDQALMHGELRRITMWLGGAMIVMAGFYYLFVHRHMRRSENAVEMEPDR